jgi:hypothetical protein
MLSYQAGRRRGYVAQSYKTCQDMVADSVEASLTDSAFDDVIKS